MSDEDFRDFMFTNPAEFFTKGNPDFFKGTVIEDAAEKLKAQGTAAAAE